MHLLPLVFLISFSTQLPSSAAQTYEGLNNLATRSIVSQNLSVQIISSRKKRNFVTIEAYQVQNMTTTNLKRSSFVRSGVTEDEDTWGVYKMPRSRMRRMSFVQMEGNKARVMSQFLSHEMCLFLPNERASHSCENRKKITIKPAIFAAVLGENLLNNEIEVRVSSIGSKPLDKSSDFVFQNISQKKITASVVVSCGTIDGKCGPKKTKVSWPGDALQKNTFRFTLTGKNVSDYMSSQKNTKNVIHPGYRSAFLIFNVIRMSSDSETLDPGAYEASYTIEFLLGSARS